MSLGVSILIRNKLGSINGFTLIELLIVIGLLGILAAIGIPSYKEHITNAREKDAKTSLRVIAAAEETYKLLNKKYFYSLGATSEKCDAWASTTSEISKTLLGNTKINSQYYYYCIFGDPSLSPQTYTANAVNIQTGMRINLNQNGDAKVCQPSQSYACTVISIF